MFDPFDPWGRQRAWPPRPRNVPAPRDPWPGPRRAVPARAPAPVERVEEVFGVPDEARHRGFEDDPFVRPPIRRSFDRAEPSSPGPASRETEPPPAPKAQPAEAPRPDPNKEELRAALAEIEASKRRLDRERERVLAETRAQVVEQMLPVLDNLDRSLAASAEQASGDGAALREGIQLVRTQFEEALARCGLTRIEAEGIRFDPAVHDAIGVVAVDDPDKDGLVVDEWQRGYRLGDRVVRPAKVRVGKLES